MTNIVAPGQGVSQGEGLYPILTGYVIGNISGQTAQPYAIPITSIVADLTIDSSIITGGTNTDILKVNSNGTLGQYTISGSGTVVAMAKSPTFDPTGTVTLPDGTTITSAALANAASFTTAATAPLNYTPTWNFSSTANGYVVVNIVPVLVPTGATAGAGQGNAIGARIGTSAVNISTVRALATTLTINVGYSGTITTAIGFQGAITNNSAAVGTAQSILGAYPSNGSGITSGQVDNYAFATGTTTIAAGVGGTVNNYGYAANVPAGNTAGTTNYGLFISGNGGASATANYAIFSSSTAPSSLAGNLSLTKDTSLFFTNQTSGAAAAAGTLLNAPKAGNPDFWVPMSVNGTAGWVPWWHA